MTKKFTIKRRRVTRECLIKFSRETLDERREPFACADANVKIHAKLVSDARSKKTRT